MQLTPDAPPADVPAYQPADGAPDLAQPLPKLRGAAWLRSPALRQAALLFGVSRLLFALTTYIGLVLLKAGTYSPASLGSALLLSWDQWDAKRYLALASAGYHDPAESAFFPLYPLLIHLGTRPFGGAGGYAVALVLSNLAFLGALWALLALARQDCGPAAASRAACSLALFPTALFCFAPYNESLFLLLTITCLLAARRRRWWLAGLLGLLAALTRVAGVLLLLPVATEYLAAQGWRWHWPLWWQPWCLRRDALALALIPLGLGLYATYCWRRFGDALAFLHAQAHWDRLLSAPWTGLWRQLVGLWQAAPGSFYQVHDLLDLAATLFVASMLVLGWRRLPRSYSLYALALLAVMLLFPGGGASGTLDPLASNQRFALEVFPAFLTLGLLVQRPATQQALLLVFAGLLAVLTLVFISGRWLV
jgi:hypothetical protein